MPGRGRAAKVADDAASFTDESERLVLLRVVSDCCLMLLALGL